MADFTISFTDNQETGNKIPDGILNATIGMTLTTILDGEEVNESINATLNFVEGVATINFGNSTNLEKFDNAINITNITIGGVDLINNSSPEGE